MAAAIEGEAAIIVTTAAITGGMLLTSMAPGITAADTMAADMDITAADTMGAAGVVRPCHNFDKGWRDIAAGPWHR